VPVGFWPNPASPTTGRRAITANQTPVADQTMSGCPAVPTARRHGVEGVSSMGDQDVGRCNRCGGSAERSSRKPIPTTGRCRVRSTRQQSAGAVEDGSRRDRATGTAIGAHEPAVSHPPAAVRALARRADEAVRSTQPGQAVHIRAEPGQEVPGGPGVVQTFCRVEQHAENLLRLSGDPKPTLCSSGNTLRQSAEFDWSRWRQA
jgi:hypothetical protein